MMCSTSQYTPFRVLVLTENQVTTTQKRTKHILATGKWERASERVEAGQA